MVITLETFKLIGCQFIYPVKEDSNYTLDLFQPSIYIAIFPYLFIASFPLFGIALVSKWIFRDGRKNNKLIDTIYSKERMSQD